MNQPLPKIWPAFFDPAWYLPLLFAAASFPLLALSHPSASAQSQQVDQRVLLGLFVITFAIALHYVFRMPLEKNIFLPRDGLLLIFFGLTLLGTLSRGLTSPAINATALLTLAYSLRIMSHSPRFFKAAIFASIACTAFLILAQILLGPPISRYLGGIHPNIYSASAIAAVSLALFAPRPFFEATTAIALACALLVSSRYGVVCVALIYVLFTLFNLSTTGPLRIAFILFLCTALLIDLIANGATSYIGAAMELSDRSRGVGSGLSGRDKHWAAFLPQFSNHPYLGFGFRNRAAFLGAHNGYLNVLLENGILGAGLLLIYYLIRLKELLIEAFSYRLNGARGRILSAMLAILFAAMLQPQLFSFGDAFGLLSLTLLFLRPGLESAEPIVKHQTSMRLKKAGRQNA
ncbi:MAG: O-antigen ligase family protein [Paracoccaceae bacterium]